MADTSKVEPVQVTAEERPHPALQKIARVLISWARLCQQSKSTEAANHPNEKEATEEIARQPNAEVRRG